ncbi:FAD-dependent oxidoreductase [Acuticoccus sp. MNP-M23]|uniref:NAD(P)/FAD-dependent oxidoreductase n=1 Tax=Acuticoccus sp. MNP-M23 TaxID=3072793 RepID=UPI0028160EC2|nr:FAD-dependent oxidoreductase [Acuticoccus sp. MNP-M23]WMS40880.1 FAD-dependent oxidoreductase [Acuticoccus sp. MNP-M23]
MTQSDVMVLGAGMVGISTALALQARGRSVVLVDRRGAAEETSFGNAGLIQSEAVMPYAFPHDLRVILGVLAGRRTDARIAWGALGKTLPFLLRYAASSSSARVMRTARANVPLVGGAIAAHRALSERAGPAATDLWRDGGYLRLYRSEKVMAAAVAADEAVEAQFGIPFRVLDAPALARAEPHLAPVFAGAVHMTGPKRINDPGALGKAYAALFEAEGGTIAAGDATTLTRKDGLYRVASDDGAVTAREAVVCLGPWSDAVLSRFGISLPLGVKRGYHRHYAPRGNAVLNHLVADEAGGYVLTPNARGLRITSGAEFARRDDPPTPVQLMRAEADARTIFPIGDALDETPWLGARPCLPDLLPVIGRLGPDGLWGNFGHHHLGFTLGPVTGELLAQMLTGEQPLADPMPYRAGRFGRSA